MKRIPQLLLLLFLCTSLVAGADQKKGGFSLSEIFPFSLFTGQQKQAAISVYDAEVPFDDSIDTFLLPNGLRCYIATNAKPEKRASLRLVVKAGSVNEDDDQSGIAHLVEHLAFCGSKHFQQNELIASLESLGVQYGPELNASTSYETTTYILDIPTDDETTLATAFLILEDWAHGLTLASEQIDRERQVIKEEWRQRQNAQTRVSDKTIGVLLSESRFEKRQPIGEMEKLFAVTHDRVRDFYRTWYRPDNMALIAVGDFDKAKIKKLMIKHFSFAAQNRPVSEIDTTVNDFKTSKAVLISDNELTQTRVAMFQRLANRTIRTGNDFREQLVESLCFSMISERMNDKAQSADSPYISASAGTFSVSESTRFAVHVAQPSSKNTISDTIADLVQLRRQASQYGFRESEAARQKKEYQSYFDSLYADRENRQHESLVNELQAHYVSGEAVPGYEWEYDFYCKTLALISLEEINAAAARLFSDSKSKIVVSGAQLQISEKTILENYTQAYAASVAPYAANTDDRPLIDKEPAAGSIISQRRIEESDILVWELSNGARVMIKATDFKNDEILMYAFSAGGTSLVDDKDFVPAATAVLIASESGSGAFDKTALRQKLAGKRISLDGFIDGEYEGFEGRSSPGDLDTLLRLQYLAFCAPRFDDEAFLLVQKKLQARLGEIENDPDSFYSNSIRSFLMSKNVRSNLFSPSTLRRLDFSLSQKIYRERFGNARDFTWVFVGAVDIPKLKELTQRYIASLPSQQQTENWRDLGIRPPAGNTHEFVKKGKNQRCRVSIFKIDPQRWDKDREMLVMVAGYILDSRLDRRLRESMNGVYSASASAALRSHPYGNALLQMRFSCDPQRADELSAAALEELGALAQSGPGTDELATQREQFRRRNEVQRKQNEYWLYYIVDSLQNNLEPRRPFGLDDFDKVIQAQALREIFAVFQGAKSQIRVDLVPE